MSAATEALDAMIASISSLETLVPESLPALSEACQRSVERTIADGTTAYKKPWQPTADGRKPLRNASKALKVATVGTTVWINITGVEARHHLGAVKGKVKRPIIPERGLPGVLAKELRAILEANFQERLL